MRRFLSLRRLPRRFAFPRSLVRRFYRIETNVVGSVNNHAFHPSRESARTRRGELAPVRVERLALVRVRTLFASGTLAARAFAAGGVVFL